jgi:pSer/pThr/pTyr-binding forkhead associated (FHA) protein
MWRAVETKWPSQSRAAKTPCTVTTAIMLRRRDHLLNLRGRVSAGLSYSALRTTAKPHARLVIEKGRSTGKQFMLSDVEAQIGRWDADGGIFPDVDLDTDDPEAKVLARHARITLSNGQYFLEDLGSTNGTFINRGKRLPPGQRQALCDGDEIIVGKTFLRFHIVETRISSSA